MIVARNLPPFLLLVLREERIALKGAMHEGEIEAAREWESLTVYFGSTNHKCLISLRLLRAHDGFLEGLDDCVSIWLAVLRMSRDDDVETIAKGAANGFIGFPPHDHGVPFGNFAEGAEICREIPGNFPFVPDDIILRDGSDEGEDHAITLLVTLSEVEGHSESFVRFERNFVDGVDVLRPVPVLSSRMREVMMTESTGPSKISLSAILNPGIYSRRSSAKS